MKVTVLGAITGTGQQVVHQLLDADHEVTAFFRTAGALGETRRPVREVKAEPGDRAAVRVAITGADVVICPVGCTDDVPAPVSTGLRAVLDVMEDTGVRRLVAVSAAPVAPPHQKSWFDRFVVHPIQHRLPGLHDRFDDMRRVETMLAQSDSDWTVFRPPYKLTDAPATGRYRTAVDTKLRRTRTLSRADLAAALVSATGDDDLVGHFVTIAY